MEGNKMTKQIQSISQETGKVNIVPTYENLLVTYARLYSRMGEKGKKQIELELSKIGKSMDYFEKSESMKGVNPYKAIVTHINGKRIKK